MEPHSRDTCAHTKYNPEISPTQTEKWYAPFFRRQNLRYIFLLLAQTLSDQWTWGSRSRRIRESSAPEQRTVFNHLWFISVPDCVIYIRSRLCVSHLTNITDTDICLVAQLQPQLNEPFSSSLPRWIRTVIFPNRRIGRNQ
jgi:hypothetical protein